MSLHARRAAPQDEVTAMRMHMTWTLTGIVDGKSELYRRFSRTGETLIEAADRVWYAT